MALLREQLPRRKCIIIYLSTYCLTTDSDWFPILSELLLQYIVRLLVFDEIHTLATDGPAYRPEFLRMADKFFPLLGKSKAKLLGLTASCTARTKTTIERIAHLKFDRVFWGPMDKTNIIICVVVPGKKGIFSTAVTYMKHYLSDINNKVLIYTNFKSRAIKKWLPVCDEFLATSDIIGDATTLHGNTGIAMKSALVEWFSAMAGTSPFSVPILIATTAANCGISSLFVRLAIRDGIVPAMLVLFQELSRIGREDRKSGERDCYCLLLSVSSVQELTIRNHGDKSKAKNEKAMNDMLEVLRFFCLADKCYHLALQEYFACPPDFLPDQVEKIPNITCCRATMGEARCLWCLGEHQFTFLPPTQSGVVQVLTTEVFPSGPITLVSMPSILLKHSKMVWPNAPVGVKQEHAEALTLQLVASGICKLFLERNKRKDGVPVVMTKLHLIDGDDGVSHFAYNDDAYWNNIVQ